MGPVLSPILPPRPPFAFSVEVGVSVPVGKSKSREKVSVGVAPAGSTVCVFAPDGGLAKRPGTSRRQWMSHDLLHPFKHLCSKRILPSQETGCSVRGKGKGCFQTGAIEREQACLRPDDGRKRLCGCDFFPIHIHTFIHITPGPLQPKINRACTRKKRERDGNIALIPPGINLGSASFG